MNLGKSAAGSAVAALGANFNGGTLVFYSGTMPASPETALSGNTALCTVDYASTAFSTAAYTSPNMQATATFEGSVSPTANGGATFARALASGGTAVADLTVGSTWIPSNVTTVGQYCTNNGNTYACTTAGTTASSGGPSGSGSSITDGSVTWEYIGSGQAFDVLMGNCNLAVGTSVTVTQTLGVPAV